MCLFNLVLDSLLKLHVSFVVKQSEEKKHNKHPSKEVKTELSRKIWIIRQGEVPETIQIGQNRLAHPLLSHVARNSMFCREAVYESLLNDLHTKPEGTRFVWPENLSSEITVNSKAASLLYDTDSLIQ